MRLRSVYKEREAKQWAAAFSGSKRAWLYAALANLALVLGLVVLPYLRGQARVRATFAAYDHFAECLYGGALGGALRALPLATEASVFAARALAQRPSLSSSCGQRLAAIAPERAVFLLPALKRSEQTVREATRVAVHELHALDAAPLPGAALSQRPLRAVLQLRAVLAAYSEDAGLLEPPPGPARRPDAVFPTSSPTPGRIPLYVGVDAVLTLWGTDAELHALGLDRTGLSYLRMHEWVDTAARLTRPKLLRDVIVHDGRVVLVWGTSKSRCGTLSGCASKSTGLAEAGLPLTSLPTPRWLAAHLHERADRGLVLDGQHGISLIADSDGVPERRDFVQPDLRSVSRTEESMPPLMPTHSDPVGAVSATLLLSSQGHSELLTAQRDLTELVLSRHTGRVDTARVSSLPAGASAWLIGCADGAQRGFAFGTDQTLVLGTLRGDEHVAATPVSLALGAPIDADDRSRDRVRRLCVHGGMLASALDVHGQLWTVFCPSDGSSCERELVARDVERYAALVTERSVLFAYAGSVDAPQIRVRSTDLTGVPSGAESIPAVCWTPSSGMCGAPHLAQLGRRIVLSARDGTDLSALESPDLGHSWLPLHGAEPNVPRELLAQTRQTPGH